MKKLILAAVIVSMVLPIASCADKNRSEDITANPYCVEGCRCTDCICCENATDNAGADEQAYAVESSKETQEESIVIEETAADEENTQTETETDKETEIEQSDMNEIQKLTEGEKAARREQQENFDEARQLLYTIADSKDKTSKINQMDRQILKNNAYDFSDKQIVFIGDSITEGAMDLFDKNGNKITYVTYTDSYLHFKKALNHAHGGSMYAEYGGADLSLSANFGNITNVDSDIIVVFAGINDYLTEVPDKRFGNLYDDVSTAGFCGAVRNFMNQLERYYSDRDIFFVTMYGVPRTSYTSYSDYNGQPTLKDYMDAERQLAIEYGFNIIDLYGTGVMDCNDQESQEFYLMDGLHPNNNGNVVLGEHIAAELSLYFGRKEDQKR